MKALFYARDVRGGQGERKLFTDVIHYLAETHKEVVKRNLDLIPEFGRWDDLFAVFDTPLQEDALKLIRTQLHKDVEAEAPSLLAKWMKSSNTSSKESRRLAQITYKYLGLQERDYRRVLSGLRKKIDIVERHMSSKDWTGVNYSAVPSQATRIYSDAFKKHDSARYEAFITKVENGEEKINAGTLYPYQIVKGIETVEASKARALDAMWNALPNYMEEPENALCVVDTSGSMFMGYSEVSPIDVSVSLGIYFAERNVGPFKNYFMTFSTEPQMQKIKGTTIQEKYRNLRGAEWGMSTNIQAVFDLLLKNALKMKATREEMPGKIYIISDMQFDSACGHGGFYRETEDEKTNYDAIKKQYEAVGYEKPDLVFWNVSAGGDTPVTKDENGTYLVSGCSPSILKYAINCEAATPYQLMLEVLGSERYEQVK